MASQRHADLLKVLDDALVDEALEAVSDDKVLGEAVGRVIKALQQDLGSAAGNVEAGVLHKVLNRLGDINDVTQILLVGG